MQSKATPTKGLKAFQPNSLIAQVFYALDKITDQPFRWIFTCLVSFYTRLPPIPRTDFNMNDGRHIWDQFRKYLGSAQLVTIDT